MKRMTTKCLGLALILLIPGVIRAVDGYWTGRSSAVWQNNGNWTGSGYPGSYNSGRWEFSTFNSAGNGNTTVDVGTGLILDAIFFDTTNAAAYTIGSGVAGSQTFTFYGSYDWIVMDTSVTNNQVFNANIATPRNVKQNCTSKTLTFAGSLWNGAGSGANTLSVYGSGDTLISGVVSNNNGAGTATMALTKYGSGTLTLSRTNTYTGTTTVSGGTLTLNRQTGGLSSSTPLTFGGSGVFNMDNTAASGTLSLSLGALTFGAGEGTVRTTRSANYDEAITFSSLAARTAGASGNFVNGGGINGVANGFNLTGAAAGFIDKGIFYGGTDYASMNGAGTYVRALNYATTGGDPNTVDIDTITASKHVKLTASPANQNSITLLSLNLSSGGVNWTQNASQTLTVPGIIKSGGGAASTISGGTGVTGGTGIELVLRTDTASDQLTISTPITGTGALTKSGAGTLTLSTNNTYTGTTTVNAGTLAYGTNDAISSGAITINGGTLSMGSYTDVVGAVTLTAGSITGSGTLTGSSFTMNNPGDTSVSVVLAGTCGLTMSGRGTLTLTGTNTYTGAMQVNSGGTLIVSSIKNGGVPSNVGASSSAAANLSLETGNATMSTLRYIGPGDTTDRLISIASYAAAALDSSGSGALKFINPGAMGRSGPNYGSLLILTGSNTNDNTLAMSFGHFGTGTGVVKSGPGRWILTGANTHTGTTETWPHFNAILYCSTAILGGTLGVTWLADYSTASPIGAGTDATDLIINGGTLQYIGTGATSGTMNRLFSLGVGPFAGTLDASGEAGSPLVLTGTGSITILGTGTRTLTLTGTNTDANTLAAVIGGTGANATSLIKSGAGTWGLSGANTYTGPTTITGGTLCINSIKNVGGAANALGQPALADATISIGSGTSSGQLTYAGTGDTSDRVINMAGTTGGVTLDQSGFGLLKFTSALTVTGVGSKTLTLQGSTIGTGEIADAIVDGSGTTTLAKSGAGTWTISGVNTYTGGTIVDGGKLVAAAAGSLPATGMVTVNAGGNLSLQDSTVRTNTVPGLTLAAGSALSFDWVNGDVDTLTTAAAVTTSGGTVGIWLNPVGSPSGSNLTIIHADGGGLTNATYLALNSAVNATLTVTDTDVKVTYVSTGSTISSAYWYGGQLANAPNAMALTDTVVGNWSTTQSSYTATTALPGVTANVVFSVTSGATQQANVVLGANMTLNSVTFNDPTTVTINADGSALTLTSTGTGSSSAISANESASLLSDIVLGANQTWTVAADKTLTAGNIFGGAYTLTKSGAGTLIMSGNTTSGLTGLTTVNAGTLQLGKSGSAKAIVGALTIGSASATPATVQYTGTSSDMIGPGTVTINGAGQLDFNGKTDTIGNIAIVSTGATNDTTVVANTAGGGVLSISALTITPAAGYVSRINTGTGSLTLGGNVTFNAAGSGRAQISGNMDLGAFTRTFTVADGTGADYDLLVDAAISSSSGAFGLTKATAGSTLVLAGASTYTGATTISAGVINIRHATALGSTASGTTVSAGTALQIQGDITVDAEALSLNGTGINSDGALRNISGANAYQGTVTLAAASRINSDSGTLTLSAANAITGTQNLSLGGSGNGVVSGTITISTGTMTKDGAGTWTLTGANTYTGITTVNAGALVLGGASGVIAATGVTTLTLNAGGTVELDNSANNNLNRLTGAAPGVTLNGGTFRFRGMNAAASSESLGQLSVSSGASTIDIVNGTGAGSSSVLTFSSVVPTAGATVNFVYSGTGTLGTAGDAPRVFITGVSDLAVLPHATVNGTSLAQYTTANGVRALAPTVEFDGSVSQAGSNVQYTSARTSESDTLTATRSIGTLTITSPASGRSTISLGGDGTAYDLTVSGQSILLTGTQDVVITRTGTATGSIIGTNPIISVDTGRTLTISAPVNGANTLSKAGAGTLVLSVGNGYTGATAVNTGVLNIQNATATGTTAGGVTVRAGAALQMQGTITVGAEALTLNGGGISNDGALRNISGANVWQGAVTLGSATRVNSDSGTLTFNTAGTSFTGAYDLTLGGTGNGTVSGIIATSTLNKDGAGTWTLSGANSYAGATTISNGVLNIQHATGVGTTAGGVTVSSGAALQMQGSITVGAEALTLNGTGVSNDGALRSISGNNVWQGTVTLGSAARVNSDAGQLTLSAAASFTGAYDLALGGASTGTVSGIIGIGAGALTKDGAGIWTLGGANTYTGLTTVNGGILKAGVASVANVSGAFGNNSSITMSNAVGVVLDITGFNTQIGALDGGGAAGGTVTLGAATLTLGAGDKGGDFAGVIAGTGALIKTGTVTQVFSGTNTYTGATTVNGGTLKAGIASVPGVSGAFGNNSAVTLANRAGVVLDITGFNTQIGSLATGGTAGGNVTLGAATLTVGGNNTSTSYAGVMSGTGGGLTKIGTGTLTLTGTNTYTGATTINLGTLSVSLLADGGVASHIGQSTSAATNLVLGGGALRYTGPSVSINRNFVLTDGTTNTIDVSTAATSLTISGGSSATTGSLIKIGPGTLVLSGASAYDGTTTVTNGVLNVQNDLALGTVTGGTIVSNGAALYLQDGVTVGNEALSLNGTGSPVGTGAMRGISGDNVWQGTVTLVGATRINSESGTLTFNTAPNSITYSGGTGQNLTLGGVSGGTVGGTITIGTGTVTKDGVGTWTLSGANTYSGLTTISTGVLNIQNNTGLGTIAGGVTVAAGAALELQGGITVGNEALSINSTGISNGGALRNISGTNVYQGTVTLATAARINSDTGMLTFNTAANSITSANLGLTLGGAGNGTVSGTITIGTGILTKDGAGTWTLTGANTYTGATAINAGALNIQHATALGTIAGGVTVASGSALQLQGGITVGNEPITLNGAGISNDGALRNTGGANFYQGTVTLASAARINSDSGTLTFNTAANSITGTFNLTLGGASNGTVGGTITISTGTLTKDGAGTWTLSGVNTYTGTTIVNGGTLKAGVATSSFGNNSSVTITNAVGAVLDITGFNTQIGALDGGGAVGGTVILGSATLTVGGGNKSGSYAGAITGSGAVTKTGTGTQVLGGTNDYAGVTTIGGGVLQLGATGSGANGPLGTTAGLTTVSSGATLDLNGFSLVTAEPLTLNGTGVSSGGALRNSSSTAATWSGLITLGSGSSIVATNGNIIVSNAGTITGPGFGLTLGGTATGSSIASIIGTTTGGLTNSGTGTWTLSGANTYTGTTAINAGKIVLSGSGTLGATTAPLTMGGGALDLGTLSRTVGALSITGAAASGDTIMNGSLTAASYAASLASGNAIVSAVLLANGGIGLSKSGAGTLTLSGANEYTGAVSISGGVLNIRNNTALGTVAGGVTVNSGFALEMQGDITVGNEALSINGTGISAGGALRNISGTNVYQGTVTLAGAARINSDTGSLTLSAANSVTSANQGLTLGGTGNGTIGGTITTGSGTLTKDGTGTWVLNGNNTYTGTTTVNGGTLQMNGTKSTAGTVTVNSGGTLSGSGGFTGGGVTTTVNAGGTLSPGPSSAVGTMTLTALTFGAGSTNVFEFTTVPASTNDQVTVTGALTINTAGVMVRLYEQGTSNDFSTDGSYKLFTCGSLTGSELNLGVVNKVAGKVYRFAKVGSDIWLYINTTGAAVEWDGGGNPDFNWQVGANWVGDAAPGEGSPLTFAGAVGTSNTNNFGANTGFSGLFFKSGASPFTLSGNTARLLSSVTNDSASLQTIALNVLLDGQIEFNTASGNITVSGNIGESGQAGSISKLGSGVLTLSGAANTYSTNTLIGAGTLKLGAANVIPNGVGMGNVSVASDAMLDLGGFSDTINGLSGAGTVDNTVAGGPYTLTVGDNNVSSTFDGVFQNSSGTLALTKTGTGTLTLTGTSTHDGLTTVSAGVLSIMNAAALGTTAAGTTVGSGATLQLQGSLTIGAEPLSLNNTGVGAVGALRSISGNNEWQGTITITTTAPRINSDAGTLTLSAANSVTGTNLGLTLGGAGNGVVSGTITTGSGTLTKADAGTWTLSGESTYTGLTTVSGGVLKLGAAGSGANTPLGTTAGNTTVSSGAGLDLNGVSLVTTEALALNGTGISSGGALFNSSSTAATWQGLISLGSAASIVAKNGDIIISNAGTILGATFGLTLDGAATGSSIASIIGTTTGVLNKNGAGMWTLSNANTYTGVTTVNAGVLLLNHATALPGGIGAAGGTSALTFNGGVIGLGNGNFNRSLAAAGTVTAACFTGNGGWAAYGADRVVNLGGASATITWATANTGFNAKTVILGASNSTHMVDLQNPIDLGTAARTIQVDNGSADIDGKLSGLITGSSSLIKTGNGTLLISGANTHTATNTVNAGTLCVSSIDVVANANPLGKSGAAATNLMLANGTTLKYVGTGGSTDRSFTIKGTAAGDSATLDASGTGPVSFTSTNSLAYWTANQARTLILSGANTGANSLSATIINNGTGVVSLVKTGVGAWTLAGTNTYTGSTTVSNGTLNLATTNSLPRATLLYLASGTTCGLNFTGTNTVVGLCLDGVSQPGGTYGTNNCMYTNATYFAGNGVLKVEFVTDVGGDHGGADWIITNNVTVGGVHWNIGRFAVSNGATATLAGSTLVVTSATVEVYGAISADSKGYVSGTGPGAGTAGNDPDAAGGGGYGGKGGNGQFTKAGGPAYGNPDIATETLFPDEMGSGGGPSGAGAGGSGGGIIHLVTTNSGAMIIDGTITAKGGQGLASGNWAGGGGSGGSIWLECGSFGGTGVVSVAGGNGTVGLGGPSYGNSGGGGGGRLAVYYASTIFTGTLDVRGGVGGSANNGFGKTGDPGSLYLSPVGWMRETGGDHGGADWIITNSITLGGVHYNIGRFAVSNGVTVSNSTPFGLGVFVVTAATVEVYGAISADERGSTQGDGVGAGATGSDWNGAGGGGYGGAGGSGNGGVAGGAAWGTPDIATATMYPTNWGSGGGFSGSYKLGGKGGGAIHLVVTNDGTILVDGSITARGGNGEVGVANVAGGGGAGGSIWLECSLFSGVGTVSVAGGAGGNSGGDGGGGGGGRIAVHYTDTLFAGVLNASGGSASDYGTSGARGTIYVPPSSWTAGAGGNHGGADWIITNNVTVGGIHYNIGRFAVSNGATATLNGPLGSFAVTSATVEVYGVITATAKGYGQSAGPGAGTIGADHDPAGGGGYGGAGGIGDGGRAGGIAWGTPDIATARMYPTNWGSGGGYCGYDSSGVGGSGGGIIHIVASNGVMVVDGTIASQGGAGLSGAGNAAAGGGSGGSIWLECGQFNGTGVVSAVGGAGGRNAAEGHSAGGGGGGRIAVHFTNTAFVGTLNVNGGGADGGAGASLSATRGKQGTVYVTPVGWIPLLGGDHGGDDWILTNNVVIGGVHYNVGRFAVNNGVTGTVASADGNFSVTSAVVQVYGMINADGTGSVRSDGAGKGADGLTVGSGGGGYGGVGGASSGGKAGGAAWGTPDITTARMYPTNCGSGGGSGYSFGYGGSGGGAIHLVATNYGVMTVTGTISANGSNGTASAANVGGGGSGGSIWLECGQFSGTGTLSAMGGNGGSGTTYGGGGGGGRIAVHLTNTVFTGSMTVNGGSASGTGIAGGGGTIYVTPVGWMPETGGDHGGADWIIVNNMTVGGIHFNVGRFAVSNAATATLLAPNGIFAVTAATVEVYGTISGNGKGSATGFGTGKGTDGSSGNGGGGGGYGGAGGNGDTGRAGGAAWGTPDTTTARMCPTNWGSSGGSGSGAGYGGTGGGVIRLTTLSGGSMVVNGTISVNGANGSGSGVTVGGGGSGGSLWLECGAFSGNGALSATGGNGAGGTSYAGGGGGGRIAVYYTTLTFTNSGTYTVAGGTAGGGAATAGGKGTVFFYRTPRQLAYTTAPATGTAGVSFSVTIQAQDEDGSPMSLLRDTTIALAKAAGGGTLSGTLTGVITAGVDSVTISTPVYSKSDTLTLTATAVAGLTGMLPASTNITFDPGPLDHFAISPIGRQMQGIPFTVGSITAQDLCDNTVTNFAATVDFGGTAGITGTSGAFSSGILSNANVRATIRGTGLNMTVTGSGKTGTSNLFDVDSGNTGTTFTFQ